MGEVNLDSKNHCCMFCLAKLLPAALELWNCSLDLGNVRGDGVFLYLLHREVFTVTHSLVFGFAGRKGSRKAKEWPVVTFRKGRENPYLPWPVGDRERRLSAVGGTCVCTVNCPWQLKVGGGSFRGELRDLDQGMWASVKILQLRLIASDCS